jgi:hypothetical protein
MLAVALVVLYFAHWWLKCRQDYSEWEARFIRAPAARALAGTPEGRHELDKILNRYITRPRNTTRREFASKFRQLELGVAGNHSHPHAASSRNAALYSIQSWVLNAGYTPYSTSASFREGSAPVHGFHMLKDFAHEPSYAEPGEDDIVVSIDDDYYRDPAWIGKYGRPIIMYTFQPRALSGQHKDATYHLDSKGRIVYRVNGGAAYTHHVWDWTCDHIAFESNVPDRTWVYSVETRAQPEDHLLVLLTPVALVPTWGLRYTNVTRLRRRDFRLGDFGAQEYVTDAGERYTSIVRLGAYGSAELPTALLSGILERVRVEGIKSAHTAQSFMTACKVEPMAALMAAGVLREYASHCGIAPREFRHHAAPIRYVIHPDDARSEIDAPSKPVGRALTAPLVTNPATLPEATNNNSLAGVIGRVEAVLTNTVPPTIYEKWAEDFVSRVVGKDKMTPWSTDQVVEWQSLPAQRGRNAKVQQFMSLISKVRVGAFMKSEPTMDCGDPRNISQQPTEHVLRLSRYTLAAKAIWKKHAWYAPGLSPCAIAQRLVALATGGFLVEADGSRFDGRVTHWMTNNVVRRAYLRICPAADRRELQEAIDAESRAFARTRERKAYELGGSRQSGSPFTTDGNTLISAAIDYFAWRLHGLDADDAFRRLGLYAGDDMVSLCPAKSLTAASAAVGMKHDCKERRTGFIGFLGRQFPRLFEQDESSMQDPTRTLAKIHLTMTGLAIPLCQAAIAKARGYLALDPAQPVTAAYCRALIRCYPGVEPGPATVYSELPYAQRAALQEGYDPSWPQDTITIHDVACFMGVDVAALERMVEQLDAVQQPEDFDHVDAIDTGVLTPKVANTEILGDAMTPAPSSQSSAESLCSFTTNGTAVAKGYTRLRRRAKARTIAANCLRQVVAAATKQ